MIKSTPMLDQYRRIKGEHPDAILFFRMGDFYEMFFEDATVASRILNIALTSRDREKETGVPMCGVPHHAADQYIARLVAKGYSVAVCDQVEDPKEARGLVKREVTRVITPGTAATYLPAAPDANSFLMGLCAWGNRFGAAHCDLSTGEFRVTEHDSLSGLAQEVLRVGPREAVTSEEVREAPDWEPVRQALGSCPIKYLTPWLFDLKGMEELLKGHFKVRGLEGFGCQEMTAGTVAAGAVLHYMKETQRGELSHITRLSPYRAADYLVVDGTTRTHLEVLASFVTGKKEASLFGIVDMTVTAMGSRKLKRWLEYPLRDVTEIDRRLQAVEEMKETAKVRRALKLALERVADLERLCSRISLGSVSPRELMSLRDSLGVTPAVTESVKGFGAEVVREAGQKISDFAPLVELLSRAMGDGPQGSPREGGIIREGYNEELDELRAIRREGKSWISRFEAGERERTGISSLKVRHNNVFGYYIEVTRANLGAVPTDYVRKQTLVNAERFITAELKDYESKVLGAEERIASLENALFSELRQEAARYSPEVTAAADAIAVVDAIAGLAEAAHAYGYCRPQVNDGEVIDIKDGRHPIVEVLFPTERFVPNDTYLDGEENRLLIITGPNMAGKSTYVRQVAVITLMAQAGSFVPAREATIGAVDQIFARVGASDNLARGQSTFMVEMNETANILNNATRRSLVILDEIGRGTSTYDGISIAWSVAEYISSREVLGSKTLFATHYHELTELSLTKKGVKNYNVAVREWNDEVIFLRKIVPGGSDRSYGIQVARLAGLPAGVIERAKEVLANLEGSGGRGSGTPQRSEEEGQLLLFRTPQDSLVSEIRGLDLDRMTPIEALLKLKEIRGKYLKESG